MHVMLDLETLSSDSNAVIVSIGAALFDPVTGELGSTFEANIDPTTDPTGKISGDTVRWWMNQSDAARGRWQKDPQHAIPALIGFTTWLGQQVPDRLEGMWGNGADFDCVVLGSAYARLEVRRPWSFRLNRCFRTLKSLVKGVHPPEQVGTSHSALDDAMWQARYAVKLLQALKDAKS